MFKLTAGILGLDCVGWKEILAFCLKGEKKCIYIYKRRTRWGSMYKRQHCENLNSRGENSGYFSSYDRQTQSWSSRENSGDLSHKAPRRLCRSYFCTQASQYPTDMCCLQSHSISRGTRRLLCYGSVPTASPDFTPDIPKERQGVSRNLAPATCPLWQVITILCFTSPAHKNRKTISPLNTFSPFDDSCYS